MKNQLFSKVSRDRDTLNDRLLPAALRRTRPGAVAKLSMLEQDAVRRLRIHHRRHHPRREPADPWPGPAALRWPGSHHPGGSRRLRRLPSATGVDARDGHLHLNPDCTGSAVIISPSSAPPGSSEPPPPLNIHFVIVDHGRQIKQVVDANAVVANGVKVD